MAAMGQADQPLRDKMHRIFQESQQSFNTHRHSISLLRKWYSTSQFDEFYSIWFECVQRVLMQLKRTANVERLIQFIGRFLKQDDDKQIEPMIWRMLEDLIELTHAKDKAVRFRVCQCIALILDGLGPDATIQEDLWADLSDAMCSRARDKIVLVRVHAALALQRL